MNRKRKFRFWCTSENRFITDPVIHGDGRVSAKTGICGRDYYYDVIIQEYTGLNDKNDVEIFEGDIVKWGGFNYLVEWNNISYKWQGRCPYNSAYIVHSTTEHFRDLMCGIIVGNIFENPDLLKNEPGA